jgi:exoribonuclease II
MRIELMTAGLQDQRSATELKGLEVSWMFRYSNASRFRLIVDITPPDSWFTANDISTDQATNERRIFTRQLPTFIIPIQP